jgi:signal transduction histidine kinase
VLRLIFPPDPASPMFEAAPQSPRSRPLHPPPPLVGRLAIGFVFLAMAALVVVPLLVQARVDGLRVRLEDVADPARTEVARLQYALSMEMSSLHLHQEMGVEEALREHAAAQALGNRTLDSLRVYARALGPQVLEPFVRLETLAGEARRRPVAPWGGPALGQAMVAANEVDAAVAEEARRSRAAIRATERLGRAVTLVLGTLALLAAGTAAWLYRRMRGVTALAEKRQAEAERALAARERAIEARSRLLRGVTHDVKNPLGAAQGFAELLEMGIKGTLTPEQARYVAGIRRSIDGALAILADLLDLARADGGGLRVERIALDLGTVAAESVEEHRSSAEAAGHVLEFPTRDEPVRVYTDPDRVRQVLGNLLSNAIKYTPSPGRVTVRTALAADGDAPREGRWAAVHVEDTGPGIAPGDRDAIFEEFHRLHPADGTPGHGLGLAIARRVAELLGGELTVGDAPEGGARFTLWLPLRDEPGADD